MDVEIKNQSKHLETQVNIFQGSFFTYFWKFEMLKMKIEAVLDETFSPEKNNKITGSIGIKVNVFIPFDLLIKLTELLESLMSEMLTIYPGPGNKWPIER